MTDLPWWFIPVFVFVSFMTVVGSLTVLGFINDLIVAMLKRATKPEVKVSHSVVYQGDRSRP